MLWQGLTSKARKWRVPRKHCLESRGILKQECLSGGQVANNQGEREALIIAGSFLYNSIGCNSSYKAKFLGVILKEFKNI